MTEDPRIQVLREFANRIDAMDTSGYDKATLEMVVTIAGEMAGAILKENRAAQTESFPAGLVRPCCEGKGCGTTRLYLHTETGADGSRAYSYRRQSNDDPYTGEMTAGEMVQWLAETG